MDRKIARENIKDSFKLSSDLNKKHYKEADKEIKKMQKNLSAIHKEISSGKAARERRM